MVAWLSSGGEERDRACLADLDFAGFKIERYPASTSPVDYRAL